MNDMERKLELRDICGYLPNELKFKYFDPERESIEILSLVTMNPDDWKSEYTQFYSFERDYLLIADEVQPILRPLSALYKTIVHDGKEIIPIVEIINNNNGSKRLQTMRKRIDRYSLYFKDFKKESK